MDCHTCYAIFASFFILVQGIGGVRELPAKCHPEEQQALLEFRDGLVLGGLESWKQGEGEDCCKWSGITCNNITGYVVQLHLTDLYFYEESKFSPALLKLKHLQYLHLQQQEPVKIAPNTMRIPGFFGSFNEMRYLSLSDSFSGEIPETLGNLSKLEVLDLSTYFEFHTNASSLGWLSGLRALNLLKLNRVDLNSVGQEWMEVLSSLPSLNELYLSDCNLLAVRTSKQEYLNFSSSLSVIDVSYNGEIGQSLQEWLLKSNMSSLVRLDASATKMDGSIEAMLIKLQSLEELHLYNNFLSELPASIANLNASLRILDLKDNLITGGIPTQVGHLLNLRELDLSNIGIPGNTFEYAGPRNRLEGALPHSLCSLKKLVTLSLSYNALNGTIPECLGLSLSNLETLSLDYNQLEGNLPTSLGLLSSLETLSLRHNRLEGNLPSTFGQLSNLRRLHLGSNTLYGQVQESHFQHLTQLEELDFSLNFLRIQLPSHWIPPFRGLKVLELDSCVVGPDFPPWIGIQKSLARVGLSNTSIQGFLPHWFSESSCLFDYLDLSNNKIKGNMPNMYNCSVKSDSRGWDLSDNDMHGPIPSLNATFYFLSLSSNQFGGSIPSTLLSAVRYSIDLSHNQLTGEIPLSIGTSTSLRTLDLSRNHLYGQLPVSMANLTLLESLHLADNNLSGMLPNELSNMSHIISTLDLGGNKFTGRIPKWIGESFLSLCFLRLRSNYFSMEIPLELMNLSSLRVLDIADNRLSGTIPHRIGNLTTMRTKETDVRNIASFFFSSSWWVTYFNERLDVERNSIIYKYTKTLSQVTSLDLANNNLSGAIPDELTDLIGLIILNLSHNQFSGLIPERIGNLVNLDQLDLRENRLAGEIPLSLTHIPRLASLNLSHNNLSGNIPMSPQLQTLDDPSIYYGNNGLCGFPLPKCEEKKTNLSISKPMHAGEKNIGIYVSIVAGFVMGFWCFSGPLLFRRSLRILYFKYMDRLIDRMFRG